MKKTGILLVAFLIIFPAAWLNAAQQEFKFNKISFNTSQVSDERTTVSGLSQGSLKRLGVVNTWGVVEAVYGSKPDWADDVTLKYFVLIKGRSSGEPVMLTGSITYINVEKGPNHVSSIFITPQTIRRYGEIVKIRAELWYNGILQDAMEWPKKKSKTQWWTRVAPIPGSLFNRYYTPFEYEAQARGEVIKIN